MVSCKKKTLNQSIEGNTVNTMDILWKLLGQMDVNNKRWEIRWVTWQDMGNQPLIVACSWDINVSQSSFPTSADAPAVLQSGSTISTSYHLTPLRIFGNFSGSSNLIQQLSGQKLNSVTESSNSWHLIGSSTNWCLAVFRPPESGFAIWPRCLHLLNLRWLWAEVENRWEALAVETTSALETTH